jgi:imidazolonepropionase-like amidohydrolase
LLRLFFFTSELEVTPNKLLTIVLNSCSCINPIHTATTVIYAGELLAVPGKPALKQQTITVVNGKITAVKAGYIKFDQTEDIPVIDLRNAFVIPGLMDLHVHLQGELGPNNDLDSLKMSAQLVGMRTVHHGMNTLMAGFTTVKDVGSNSQYMHAYRDSIERGGGATVRALLPLVVWVSPEVMPMSVASNLT